MKITPGYEGEPPEITDIYWFIRAALNLWSYPWKLRALPPPPPPDLRPFPVSVLGRFGSAASTQYYSVLKTGPNGEVEEDIVEVPPKAAPPPGQPVDPISVYRAAGLEAELPVKLKYQNDVYDFFEDVERSDPPAKPVQPTGAQASR